MRILPRASLTIAEFGLIVVGVFVALLAESWWSDREDKKIEQQILVDAISEFQENIEILDADISTNNSVLAFLRMVEEMPTVELLALSDDQVSELFAIDNVITAGFDPAMGSIDALARSGDLRLISDVALRRLLSRWSALITRAERMDLQNGQNLMRGAFASIPSFDADGRWTEPERNEIRARLGINKAFLEINTAAQVDLRTTAEDILARLLEITG